jgi:hypothetical protein
MRKQLRAITEAYGSACNRLNITAYRPCYEGESKDTGGIKERGF